MQKLNVIPNKTLISIPNIFPTCSARKWVMLGSTSENVFTETSYKQPKLELVHGFLSNSLIERERDAEAYRSFHIIAPPWLTTYWYYHHPLSGSRVWYFGWLLHKVHHPLKSQDIEIPFFMAWTTRWWGLWEMVYHFRQKDTGKPSMASLNLAKFMSEEPVYQRSLCMAIHANGTSPWVVPWAICHISGHL